MASAHGSRLVPKRQVEELAQRAAQDFDEFYRCRACGTENTKALLVLTVTRS